MLSDLVKRFEKLNECYAMHSSLCEGVEDTEARNLLGWIRVALFRTYKLISDEMGYRVGKYSIENTLEHDPSIDKNSPEYRHSMTKLRKFEEKAQETKLFLAHTQEQQELGLELNGFDVSGSNFEDLYYQMMCKIKKDYGL